MAHQAQLDDELVNQLLRFLLGDNARVQVTLQVDVQKGGVAAQGHGGAVVFLDGGQVGEIQPLHGLPGALRGRPNIKAIARGHLFHGQQGADLLGQFLPQADALIRGGAQLPRDFLLFFRNQPVDSIQRHAPVIPNDASAAVGVRQSGQQAR